ncbi:MAG: hypothetical protein HY308_12015 [Gammaproteobacteria bacterium]|nr:hypothetical protein [Gammaproteobacteria bacterium]
MSQVRELRQLEPPSSLDTSKAGESYSADAIACQNGEPTNLLIGEEPLSRNKITMLN